MHDIWNITRRRFLKSVAMLAACMATPACLHPEPSHDVEREQRPASLPHTPKPQYAEAPMLAGSVVQGQLPPVDERLPEEPLVINPWEQIGEYGGTWHRLVTDERNDLCLNHRLTYECLVRYNIDGTQIIPNVAKSWSISPDGSSFDFRLRKGMKWSDGNPFTANDLVFHFEAELHNPELELSFPAWLKTNGNPGHLERIDDYTVHYEFSQPHGLFMYLMPSSPGLSLTAAPAHYMCQFHPAHADADKLAQMAHQAGWEDWVEYYQQKRHPALNPERPVMAAWQITAVAPQQPMVAIRNPYYWKVDSAGNQLPYIDRIEFKLVADAAACNAQAMAGETDMQMRHISFYHYLEYEQRQVQGDYRILLWTPSKPTDTCIYPNVVHQDPEIRWILADKRFRRALSLGINRQEIIDEVYLGMAEPRQIAPLPSSPFYDEAQATNLLAHDPGRANELLDEMGLLRRDQDGYRLRPDGQRLKLRFEHADHFATWQPIGDLLSKHWRQLGLDVENIQYVREEYQAHTEANKHDIGCWNGTSGFNPLIDPRSWLPYNSGSSLHAVPYARWYESGGAEGEEPTGDLREVCDLYDRIKVTVEPDEQVALWLAIMALNRENLWTIGISTDGPQPVIVKSWFRNVPATAVSDFNLLTPGNTMPEQYFIRQ